MDDMVFVFMSGYPVQCVRGEKPASGDNNNFVITAEDFNRMMSGIENTFPLEVTSNERTDPHPFKPIVEYIPYPSTHPKYDQTPLSYDLPDDLIQNQNIKDKSRKFYKGVWVATITPGVLFCQDTSGVGPVVTTEAWLLTETAIERIKAEIKGGDFSSCVTDRTDPDPDQKPASKYKSMLYESPKLILYFRDYDPQPEVVGTSIQVKKKDIPFYFSCLGCVSSDNPQEDERKLFSSDIVMQVARPTTNIQFTFEPDGVIAGQSYLSINNDYKIPPNCGQSEIVSTPEYIPPVSSAGGDFLKALMDIFNDPGIDQFVVARVYIVHPPAKWKFPTDDGAGAPWAKDFVRQFWFKNVCYGWGTTPRPVTESSPPNPLLAVTGALAGGVGYMAAADILSTNNTLTEMATAFTKGSKVTGDVWYV